MESQFVLIEREPFCKRWFAAPFQILQKAEMNSYLLTYTAMAAVIPLISIFIYIKKIPMFEKYLLKMGNNFIKRKKLKKQSEGVLLRLFCRSPEERIFFPTRLEVTLAI